MDGLPAEIREVVERLLVASGVCKPPRRFLVNSVGHNEENARGADKPLQ